jgi:hypothetical protein
VGGVNSLNGLNSASHGSLNNPMYGVSNEDYCIRLDWLPRLSTPLREGIYQLGVAQMRLVEWFRSQPTPDMQATAYASEGSWTC